MRVLSMDGDGGTPAEGFEMFFKTERRAVRRVALRLSGDRGIAEDVAQETMLRAWRKWDPIAHYDVPALWARRVAINVTRSRLRRKSPRMVPLVSCDDHEPVDWDAPVFVAIRCLPERQRIAVVLRYLEDMAITDVANVMGSSEVAVRHLLSRGLQRLRSQFPIEVGERG